MLRHIVLNGILLYHLHVRTNVLTNLVQYSGIILTVNRATHYLKKLSFYEMIICKYRNIVNKPFLYINLKTNDSSKKLYSAWLYLIVFLQTFVSQYQIVF